MEKVIVFGGSGFLGSHVADQLTLLGFDVTIFDVMKSQWLNSNQHFIKGDILDREAVVKAIENMDYVYNFAALADLNKCLDRPKETVELNILGNLNVLEGCRENEVRRFIYSSTVYVNSREGGFYRCSKQAAESYIEEFGNQYGIDYTILRYGSLYGERSDQSNGVYRIVKEALVTGRLRYRGNSDAVREYIHVLDAAHASVKALAEDFRNKSVVLTGQEPMKVSDMLELLAEILGYPSESIEFLKGEDVGHYSRTPYAYRPKVGQKYTPPLHVDFGQGLLELIHEIQADFRTDESKI